MNPTLREQLKEWKRKNQPESKKKRKEKINWADIMGMNKPVYRRGKGGAWRNVR